jgi:hypothetical protein
MKRQPQKRSSSGNTKQSSRQQPKSASRIGKPQSKKKQTAPRTEAQYLAKSEKFKETWDRVLHTISKMRTDKVSLSQASKEVGVNPRTVRKWGNSALRKQKSGKYVAKKQDNLLRVVMIPTPEGTREIGVRGSRQVSLIAEYWNALHLYLQTGNSTQLKTFHGKHVKDSNGKEIPFVTDLNALNRLGHAGVLSFESLYARTA